MFFFTSMPCLYEPSTEAAVDANPTAATVSMILPLTSFPEIMSLKSVLSNHRSSHRASWVSGEIMINLLKWSSMDRIYLTSFLKLFGLCVFSFCAMSESLRLEVRHPRPLSFNLHTLQSDKLSAVQTVTRLIYSKLFLLFVCFLHKWDQSWSPAALKKF